MIDENKARKRRAKGTKCNHNGREQEKRKGEQKYARAPKRKTSQIFMPFVFFFLFSFRDEQTRVRRVQRSERYRDVVDEFNPQLDKTAVPVCKVHTYSRVLILG